jgi:hypothetical protein
MRTMVEVRSVLQTAKITLMSFLSADGKTKTTSSPNPAVTSPKQGGKNNNVGAVKPITSTLSIKAGGNKTSSVAATATDRGKINNSKGTKTTSVAVTTTQGGNGGGAKNNNNGKNNGTETSSSAAAATTAAAAAANNGGNKGNNNNNNGDPQKSTSMYPSINLSRRLVSI